MRQRKVVNLLEKIPVQARKQFAEYLRSPLHAHRPRLSELVELLDLHLYTPGKADISSESFYALLYPGKTYNANDLNRLCSLVNRELKEFLALLEYKQDRAAQLQYRLHAYYKHGWKEELPKEFKVVRKRMDADVARDEHYFYRMANVAFEEIRYTVENLPKNPGTIFQPYSELVDTQYLIAKWKTIALAANHDIINKTQHDIRNLTDIEALTRRNLDILHPLVRIYFHLRECMTDDGHDYAPLEALTEAYIPRYDDEDVQTTGSLRISKADALIIYNLTLTMLTRRINRYRKTRKWLRAYVAAYTAGLKKGVLLEHGKLNIVVFMGLIRMLSRHKMFAEAHDMHHRYKAILSDNDSDTGADLTEGTILWMEGQPENAYKPLLKAKNNLSSRTHIMINLSVRLLNCIVAYELDQFDTVHYEAQALRTFVHRNKRIPANRRRSYAAFCSAILSLERIAQGPQDRRKSDLAKLQAKIEAQPAFNAKDWVGTQIEALHG